MSVSKVQPSLAPTITLHIVDDADEVHQTREFGVRYLYHLISRRLPWNVHSLRFPMKLRIHEDRVFSVAIRMGYGPVIEDSEKIPLGIERRSNGADDVTLSRVYASWGELRDNTTPSQGLLILQ